MKKIISIILTIFVSLCGIMSVNASTITYKRLPDDLGVNKKWIINDNNIDNVYRTPRVNASEKIYDYKDILTEDEEKLIKYSIDTYISRTNMDLVVLVTDFEYGSDELEEYAADFYDYNDFGLTFENYSGSILIINMNSYNRFYNIFTFGNAILYYNDARLESALDAMYNNMVNGDYKAGILNEIDALSDFYDNGIPSANQGAYITEDGHIAYNYVPPYFLAFIISSITSLVITLIFVNRNKMIKKETAAKEYLDRKSINISKREDVLVNSHTSSYVSSSSSSSGHSGGSSISFGSSGGSHGGGSGRSF